jgi:hypothetical protein
VQANQRYTLIFTARADAPRTISFGVARGSSPWTTLGLYDQIELTPEWQRFERAFVIPQDEPNARIHFDVGAGDASVELASVTLLDPSSTAMRCHAC